MICSVATGRCDGPLLDNSIGSGVSDATVCSGVVAVYGTAEMFVRTGASGSHFCSGPAGLVNGESLPRVRGGTSAVEVILFPTVSAAPTIERSISAYSVLAQFVTPVMAGSKKDGSNGRKTGLA